MGESQRFSAPALDQRRPVATSPALSEAHPAVSPAPPPDDLLVRLGADFAAALARGDRKGAKALRAAINQILDAEDLAPPGAASDAGEVIPLRRSR